MQASGQLAKNTICISHVQHFVLLLATVKPVLSDHAWAKKKWSLNRGGLLIEVKMHCKATIGAQLS